MLIVRDALANDDTANQAARVLAQRALKAGSQDDITVVVMQFTQ
jgi:serine/threonine protein phosphatase PrpC